MRRRETHLMLERRVFSSAVELSVEAVHARHHSGVLVPAQGVDGWQHRHFVVVIVAATEDNGDERHDDSTRLAFHG